MDLFVCGNGFDIAHKLKTGYKFFRKWLIETYGINPEEEFYLWPDYATNYKGLEKYDEKGFANLFLTLIDNAEMTKYRNQKIHQIDWNEFEELLGIIDWLSIDSGVVSEYDKEGDVNPWKTSYNYQDAASHVL